jgi:ABC-type multidrug transport system permease subunit
MSKSFFSTDYNAPYSFLVSNYNGVIGPLVTVWLLFAVIAYILYQKFAKIRKSPLS